MNNPVDNQKGAALIVTLAVISVLIVAALQLRKFTTQAVISGAMAKEAAAAGQKARSGIEFARMVLIHDAQENETDSLQELWADTLWLEQGLSLMGYAPGEVSIKIEDELSKIQLNALLKNYPGNEVDTSQAALLENFWNLYYVEDPDGDIEAVEPVALVNALKDWLDSGDDDAISGLSGAESDYYLGLDPPYEAANGPLNHIREIFSVKGYFPEMLGEASEEAEALEEITVMRIPDCFTVYGVDQSEKGQKQYAWQGKININTARLEILSAMLPTGMEDLAQELVDYREERAEQGIEFRNTLDKGWYKKVIDLSKKEQQRMDQIITYSSDIFSVEAAARENNTSIRLKAYLLREKDSASGKWACRIIRMERFF